MSILALDLSLTATGWARSDGTSGVIVPRGEFARGIDRLRWIRYNVRELVTVTNAVATVKYDMLVGTEPEERVSLVVIEGYAFGRIQQAHHLGELGGVIRVWLADMNIPFVEVPPSSLKLFATGKGNAGKPEVLLAAIQKLQYGGNSHDEADAKWLLEMALCNYGGQFNRATDIPEAQARALSAITWPKLSIRTEALAHG